MTSYLNVRADELQIGDMVRGRGKLACNVEDHPTLDGFVTAVFEKSGEETPLTLLRAKQIMRVRYAEDE